ncbi:hypothetical protein GMA92_15400 [Turicibacter sanguinis]|uniref:Uncharacterized protein n=1 Tax=Turicibacter sanguinis TaxID=154288 RepID=A0A9X4XG98_9FIRM|nr:hypothetical protein [Turicibacter sanguinis]MTK73910.1 hypothetical protein [Turicibacter sanguinis]
MMTTSDSVICRKAVETFGVEIQQIVAMEELGELIQAISKIARWECSQSEDLETLFKYIDNLSEEIADVEIILEQLKQCYGCHIQVNDHKRKKLDKLKSMVEG